MSIHKLKYVRFLCVLHQPLTTDKVRQARISKLRDKRNQLSDGQWEDVLSSTLLQRRIQGSEAGFLEQLEVLATLVKDQLSITFRNNISGITQKLGEVIFIKDENQELDIIRWAGIAVERSNRLDREVRDLTFKYDEQSKKFEMLNHQLEDMIRAKIEHESSLLQNFKELLNTKKLKIRDQQRLLASARVDPNEAAKLQHARATSKPHTTTPSRAGKRKAESDRRASKSPEESGFEGEGAKEYPENDMSETMNTPEHSDQDATEDESGDDPDSAHQAATIFDRGKAVDGPKEKFLVGTRLDALPPRGDLLSGVSGVEAGKNKSTLFPEAGNVDEETDDDEL